MRPVFCQLFGPSRRTPSSAVASRRGYLLLTLAVLLGLGGQPALAQTFYDDALTLRQQPSGSSSATVNYAGKRTDAPYNTYTRLGNSNASPAVAAPNVGTYDLDGNSTLTLTGGSLIVSPAGQGTTYTGGWLRYRVYRTTATTLPAYSQLTLPAAGTDSFGDPIYAANGTNVNLLAGLVSGGNYTLEVQFGINMLNGGNTTPAIDPSGANGYSVSFYVTPPPTTPAGGTTTWQSTTSAGGSTDWTLPANWDNGVPTRFANAIIPPKANSTVVFPILNSPTTLYEVNNLTLQGAQSTSAGRLTINTATLRVYGNISQAAGGLTGTTTNNPGVTDALNNSTLVLAGTDQTITGNLSVSDIIVGGSGVKSVLNQLTPTNILAFQPTNATNGVVVQSATQDAGTGAVSPTFAPTGNVYVQLASSAAISTVAGQGETNTSYVRGVVRADRQLTANTPADFGNLGLTLTANHTPSTIVVYRVVGAALPGPANSSAVPIKRYYQVIGDDNSNNASFAGSTISVGFRYLNSTDELNGNPENQLQLFRTVNASAPYQYQPLAGTRNQATQTVSRAGLNSLPSLLLTLGNQANPLPVELAAFTATQQGTAALLRWATAQEVNSDQFEVEAAVDGVHFVHIGTVAGHGTTSSRSEYQFADGQLLQRGAGEVYYRLRQVDQDGTARLSPVRVVAVGAAEAAEALRLAPNPARDYVQVLGAVGAVDVLDVTGRVVRQQVSPAPLLLTGLPAGVYVVRSATRTARLVVE